MSLPNVVLLSTSFSCYIDCFTAGKKDASICSELSAFCLRLKTILVFVLRAELYLPVTLLVLSQSRLLAACTDVEQPTPGQGNRMEQKEVLKF